MADHTTALVPIECWSYSAPDLRYHGRAVDIGLFLEALIYYDCILLNITTQSQFAEFLQWFIQRGSFNDLLSLMQDGVVRFYDYSFHTTAVHIEQSGEFRFVNMQDEIQAKPNTFPERVLHHPVVQAVIPGSRSRILLYRAFRGNVIEAKASEFGNAVTDAECDHRDARRNALVVQAFVDELYAFRKLGRPPRIEAIVAPSPDDTKHRITWNVSFEELAKLGGPELNFHTGTPLNAGAISNRLLWSAAQLGSDIYVAQPMGMLVGDKLYEATERVAKAGEVIEELKSEVEFPDVRRLVNEDKLTLRDVLAIRKRAHRFRAWLQHECAHDRNAIIAYHQEVTQKLGLAKLGGKSLKLFGALGGVLGPAIGSATAGPEGGVIGGVAGGISPFLFDVVGRMMGQDWRPVVFGDWLKGRIATLVKGKTTSSS